MLQPIKGGKITTIEANQELITEGESLKKVTIINLTNREINVIVNLGNQIPMSAKESLSLGELKVVSIIIVEKDSTVKYIGV